MGVSVGSSIYNAPSIYESGAGGGGGGGGSGGGASDQIFNNASNYYEVVQIGNLLWCTKNLELYNNDFEFTTAKKSSPTVTKISGIDSLFYNEYAMRMINDDLLENGWRVATHDDFLNLQLNTNLDGAKSVYTWSTPGTNSSKFNVKNEGTVFNGLWGNSNGSDLWEYPSNDRFRLIRFRDDSWNYIDWNLSYNIMAPIRICKDA